MANTQIDLTSDDVEIAAIEIDDADLDTVAGGIEMGAGRRIPRA